MTENFETAACPEGRLSEDEIIQRLDRLWDEPAAASTAEFSLQTIDEFSEPLPVFDQYQIDGVIGRGGMGIVYRAQQLQPIRRPVAIKLIRSDLASRQLVRRFENERQTLAELNHPGVARVLDAGTTNDDRPYFVMELVDGVPLNRFCETEQPTLDDRLKLFMELCRAVEHAHSCGIIHRDLKPSNILVSRRDDQLVPRVIDFGLAKAFADEEGDEGSLLTQADQMLGTVQYMSPEQARVSRYIVGCRSDLYSLGVILYELITGATPFAETTDRFELLTRIRNETPVAPSERLPKKDSAPDFDAVCLQCLQKSPDDRYTSVVELRQDVQQILNGQPVCAQQLSTDRGRHTLAGNASLVGLVIAGFAVILAATVPFSGDSSEQSALTLDGDDCVVVPTLMWDGTTAVTLEAWIQPRELQTSKLVELNGLIGLNLQLESLQYASVSAHNPDEMFHFISDDRIALHEWTHIAAVFEDRSLSLFVNGRRQHGRMQQKIWPDSDRSEVYEHYQDFPEVRVVRTWDNMEFAIGGNPWAQPEWFLGFKGQIKSVRVSDGVRYKDDFVPLNALEADSRTLALFRLNDFKDTQVLDTSGNKHHGRLRRNADDSPE